MASTSALPVDAALPRILELLENERLLILESPPGTGKTTRVPPALLDAEWLGDAKVLMLEPRRVAARAAAERIAAELGGNVGGVVGLRTRFDTRVGVDTRLEVVTEGVLTRMLIDDPGLSGVGAVIFDEFHERSIHADTGLAFVRETASALRDDLRIILMSATVDAKGLARQLDTDTVVQVDAPVHPVETRYRAPAPGRREADDVADAVIEVLAERHRGDVLVFLAGAGDISRVDRALRSRLPGNAVTTPLHGSLPAADQDRALRPDENSRRKVVLATPIAETSITIDGVSIVVDSGRRRRPEHDIGRGMSRLRTVNASQAATDQRRGRAGRQGPGLCVRLWPEIDQERRRRDEPAEILTSDLTSLALQIAAWGATDEVELPWIDPPPAPALAAGRGVLTALDAIDDTRRLTDHGKALVALGAEPRLAHMMVRGAEMGAAATACDLAAILSDRDLLSGRDRPIDLRSRLEALAGGRRVDRGQRERARETARRWRRRFDAGDDEADLELVGPLISLAFPERIAQRRADAGSFLMASGAGVGVSPSDALARTSLLAVAETEGVGADARVVTAAPISRTDIDDLHGHRLEDRVRGEWDRRKRDVVFERQERLGALILRREPDADPSRDALDEALLAGVRREGLSLLRWNAVDTRWRERLAFLRRHLPDAWPAVDDAALVDQLEDWLGPALGSARRRVDLEMIDLKEALNNLLDWRRVRDVERLAPSHWAVPSGSRIPIDYAAESGPVLAVRLQELFGLASSPALIEGTVPVVVHLLSPAHRPVQVTTDLASFWAEGYADVRRELRGRYPRHEWPEDPTTATPTNRAKRRR